MQGSYNSYLVALSLLVAMFASYTALDLAARIGSLRDPRKRFLWLVGGAFAMGMGTWSMHFIGMLAFRMPIRLGYDPLITACSMLIAIVISGFALYVVTLDELSRKRLAVGGVLMGLGVAAMHYTGMAALRMHPGIVYSAGLFWASIAIAVVASWVALWISFQLRDGRQQYVLVKRCAAGFVMGLAIAGMHYTGMAAANFPMGSICAASNGVNTNWLAFTVAGATLLVLPMTLMYSMLDVRYDLQEFQLNASLEKASLSASLAEANERLLAMATEDTLTGLPNRNSLIERIENAIIVAQSGGRAFVLMFIDLDEFKTVNDSLGHTAGDKLLQEVARRLLACVRAGDTVARLSGDEFVVLLEEQAGRKEAAEVARQILERMQRAFLINGTPLRMTASVGIASYPEDGESVEGLLKNADTAMYDAKQNGRNSYRYFDAEMSEALARTLAIHRGLTEAIEQQQFSLRFQPKFSGARRQMVGAEVLLRWQHPKLGEIPPLEFIPIAERTGQIVPIGNWVIGEVCRYVRRWKQARMSTIKLAINLSCEQLRQPGYVDSVMAIVNAAGVEPDWIMFEMTETVAMRDVEMSAEVIRRFQSAGFDVAIDDFGKGYSSLAYLQQFRVKQLKIDRFFVEGLDRHGEEGYAMVSAIISMAHALEMAVVAEGVETHSQLAQLRRLECDEVQGFLLARPLTARHFEELLAQPQQAAQEHDSRLRSRSWSFSRWREREVE